MGMVSVTVMGGSSFSSATDTSRCIFKNVVGTNRDVNIQYRWKPLNAI